MLKKIKSQSGFSSLIEVTVTAVVFAIAVFGLMASMTMLQPDAVVSSKRLEAAYIGKSIIDNFRSDVNAESWYFGNSDDPLNPDGGSQTRTITRGGIDYDITYEIITVPGMDLRKLTMNIEYPDDL